MNAAELDDRIAGAKLDAKIVEYLRQQATARFWNIYDAGSADVARRRWRPLVLAGGVRCGACHEPIMPEARWVIDPHGPLLPEHAGCVIDGGQAA